MVATKAEPLPVIKPTFIVGTGRCGAKFERRVKSNLTNRYLKT
jgi:hypothetical protein